MKEIPLTQGQVALVDDEDFERVNKYKWHARWSKGTNSFYADRSEWNAGHQQHIQMHRTIMHTPKGMICDHIHHNTLDNRKSELRNCLPSQSSMNRNMSINNSTGFKNISKFKNGYHVRIKVKGKCVFNKWFKYLAKAITARDDALKKYHGEFANLGDISSEHVD